MEPDPLTRTAKRSGWKSKEPDPFQLDQQRRLQGLPLGIWGKYLEWCIRHPNETIRSHALNSKQVAKNYACEINLWRQVSDRTYSKMSASKRDGHWESNWAYDEDDNGLMQWYVFTKWVPNKKKGRTTNASKKKAT